MFIRVESRKKKDGAIVVEHVGGVMASVIDGSNGVVSHVDVFISSRHVAHHIYVSASFSHIDDVFFPECWELRRT